MSQSSVQIHVGMSAADASRMVDDHRSIGCGLIRLELDGVESKDGLVDRLASTFLFPHNVSGLDGAVDLMSDLAWFGNDVGYVVMVNGLAIPPLEVSRSLLAILPVVADRWRSQQAIFQVLLPAAPDRDQVINGLAFGNGLLAEAGQYPWVVDVGPVPVVEHGCAG